MFNEYFTSFGVTDNGWNPGCDKTILNAQNSIIETICFEESDIIASVKNLGQICLQDHQSPTITF